MTRLTTVVIIGLGSRGLSVLERLVTLVGRDGTPGGDLAVEIVDPRADGAGVHATDQPDYLLLNTTAAQVSMFPDAATVGGYAGPGGPSLYEWATARGLRVADDGYTVGATGRPIRPTDFLPRRLLGEYLGWFFGQLRQRLPARVRLRTHRAEATGLGPGPDRRLLVALDTGETVEADYAFLTTGYTTNRPGPAPTAGRSRLITAPYPLPEQVARVRPGETVAIGGFGLSAMDMMSCLTVGRGGRFVADGEECRYLPSGREPRLLFYSRSGLPCRARPQVMQVDEVYQPLVFTPGEIDARRDPAGAPLDFDRDVLPLVYTEMRIAYRRREAALAGSEPAAALARRLATAGDPAGVRALLDRLDTELGRFDPVAAFDGGGGMLLGDRSSYQKWLAEVVKADLAEGRLGFAGSPLKASLDTVRALRDTFRYAIDFGGLHPTSLADFHRRLVPMINRAVVGPQYERHSELLALFADGFAQAPFGPAPAVSWQASRARWSISSTRLDQPCTQEVDWLAAANLPPPGLQRSASPLIAGMYDSGQARPHLPDSDHVPGIDIDPDQHPVRPDGTAEHRLWVLGPLCEGATYYNNLVPSPGSFSRPVFDAHRCVAELLGLPPLPRPPVGPPDRRRP